MLKLYTNAFFTRENSLAHLALLCHPTRQICKSANQLAVIIQTYQTKFTTLLVLCQLHGYKTGQKPKLFDVGENTAIGSYIFHVVDVITVPAKQLQFEVTQVQQPCFLSTLRNTTLRLSVYFMKVFICYFVSFETNTFLYTSYLHVQVSNKMVKYSIDWS